MGKRNLYNHNVPESSVFARRVIGGAYNQHLMSVLSSFKASEDRGKVYIDLNPWYQRGDVWTLQQKRDLIDTIFSGLTIPPIYLRQMPHDAKAAYEVVDGKQRLTTLLEYVSNAFSYIAPDGKEWYYKDLTKTDQAIFDSSMIAFAELRDSTDEEIVKIYNRLNFCGTPHTESQRANMNNAKNPITAWPQERLANTDLDFLSKQEDAE